MEEELQQRVEFLRQALQKISEALSVVRFDPESDVQIHAVALHATIVELAASSLCLVDCGRETGVPIILRSVYEAMIELQNLLADANYMERIKAANLDKVVDFLNKGATDAVWQELGKSMDVATALREFQAEITYQIRTGG